MRTALDVRGQLVALCGCQAVAMASDVGSRVVRRALLVGLHTQTAEHAGEGKYLTVSWWLFLCVHKINDSSHSLPLGRKCSFILLPVSSMHDLTHLMSCIPS